MKVTAETLENLTIDNCGSFAERFELRHSVIQALNSGLKCAGPLTAVYGDSIEVEDGRKQCGSVLLTSRWKKLLSKFGFEENTTSSCGWRHLRLQGYKDIECNGIVTEIRVYEASTVIHSLAIQMINTQDKLNPIVSTYTGNIEDFGNQVLPFFEKIMRKKRNERLNGKYGL